MGPDRTAIRALVADTLTMLLQNSLPFQVELQVQGLIGVTVDKDDVFIIQLDERFVDGPTDKTLELNSIIPPKKSHSKLHHSRFRTSFGSTGAKNFTKLSTANRILTKYSAGYASAGSTLDGARQRNKHRSFQLTESTCNPISSLSTVKPFERGIYEEDLLPSEVLEASSFLNNSAVKNEQPDEPQMETGGNDDAIKWEESARPASSKDNAIYLSDDGEEIKEEKECLPQRAFTLNNFPSMNLQGIVEQALHQARLVNHSTASYNDEQNYFGNVNATSNSSQQLLPPPSRSLTGQQWTPRINDMRNAARNDSTIRYRRHTSKSQQYPVTSHSLVNTHMKPLPTSEVSILVAENIDDPGIYLEDGQDGIRSQWRFQCNVCAATFRHQPSLYRHQIKAHGRAKNKIGRPINFDDSPYLLP